MPRTVTLEYILQNFVPGSFDQPWSWDDEERDIRSRLCGCCVVIEDDVHVGVEGHYQEKFEAYVAEHGIPGEIPAGRRRSRVGWPSSDRGSPQARHLRAPGRGLNRNPLVMQVHDIAFPGHGLARVDVAAEVLAGMANLPFAAR